MPRETDIRPVAAAVHFLPIETRLPLKFGTETLTSVTLARVRIRVEDRSGRSAEGWGETPLSVQWVWPSSQSYASRLRVLERFTVDLAERWLDLDEFGHPVEIGHRFVSSSLKEALEHTRARADLEASEMPWLAALVSASPFDLALHDAYGILHGRPVYETYTGEFMNEDLTHFLEPAEGSAVSFRGLYPADFLVDAPATLPAWHLVGGKDAVVESELTGDEPDDGYPVLLSDWIRRDGLDCLKVKLRGNDAPWDYDRLVAVGRVAREGGAHWLSADFNCTVEDPAYVNEILDRLVVDEPSLYGMLLYVEQPFPYELSEHRIDVHSTSARKPLFMDESAHDWTLVRLGRSLGWTGVALKTCKTQTGALLALSWAKAHGMTLMVQDLTNPMLAQVPHVLLAAHAGTIMGVETNAMQFYPDASAAEAAVHPGIYRRRGGRVDLSTVTGSGFGYRAEEIARTIPPPVAECGRS